MSTDLDRRRFLQAGAGLGLLAAGVSISADRRDVPPPGEPAPGPLVLPWNDRILPAYPDSRPRVILIRFGGGVRRQETIADSERSTYCPFIYHELYRNKGILLRNVEIENNPKYVTSHGEG